MDLRRRVFYSLTTSGAEGKNLHENFRTKIYFHFLRSVGNRYIISFIGIKTCTKFKKNIELKKIFINQYQRTQI
jgi:hypothetical protein